MKSNDVHCLSSSPVPNKACAVCVNVRPACLHLVFSARHFLYPPYLMNICSCYKNTRTLHQSRNLRFTDFLYSRSLYALFQDFFCKADKRTPPPPHLSLSLCVCVCMCVCVCVSLSLSLSQPFLCRGPSYSTDHILSQLSRNQNRGEGDVSSQNSNPQPFDKVSRATSHLCRPSHIQLRICSD